MIGEMQQTSMKHRVCRIGHLAAAHTIRTVNGSRLRNETVCMFVTMVLLLLLMALMTVLTVMVAMTE